MKRLKRKLITCVTAAIATFFAFAFPFGFVFALADESENTANYEVILNEGEAEEIATSQAPRNDEHSESQTEGDDSGGAEETVYPQAYSLIDTDGKMAKIELLDEHNMTLRLYLEDGTALASVNGWYERADEENIIDLYAYDTWFGTVELCEDGTAVYTEETSEELPPADEDFDEIKDAVLDELEGIIPETEWSAWFKEKILPYILEFLAVAGGALATFALVLKRLNLRLGDLIDAVRVLRKANEDSEETKAAVQEQKEERTAWEQRQEEEKKAWQEQQMQIMAEGFAKIAESVTNKLDDAVQTVHKILDVEEIAYRENPVLVSKGTAHKIEEVIHGDEKKNEPHDEA